MLSEGELRDLAADITAHGLKHPIVTLNGAILDGRNRERACVMAGVEPRRFAGQILNGVDVFYETHPRADSDRLISRLSHVTISHLLGKGSGRWHAWKSLDQRGGSLIDATAEEIAILYNKTRA